MHPDRLRRFLETLELHERPADFRIVGRIPDGGIFTPLIAPEILYGYFRAWVRQQGIDPDTFARHRSSQKADQMEDL